MKNEQMVLTVGEKTYTDQELRDIGKNLASFWGASCLSYTIKRDEQIVEFLCREVDEFFVCELAFERLSSPLGERAATEE